MLRAICAVDISMPLTTLATGACCAGSGRRGAHTVASASAETPGTRRAVPRVPHRSQPKGVSARPSSERQHHSTAAAAAGAAALDASALEGAAESPSQRAFSFALSKYRALVLDSSYRPVDVVNWQRAICMGLLSKADVLEFYDVLVNSVSQSFYLPAVLKTRWYNHGASKWGRISLSRQNVMLRDSFECQYCGARKELTLDHVHPVSRGGRNTWENLVTCCSPCNRKKGDKTLKQLRWKLRQPPRKPSPRELDFMLAYVLSGVNMTDLPAEWEAYLQPILAGGEKQKRKREQ